MEEENNFHVHFVLFCILEDDRKGSVLWKTTAIPFPGSGPNCCKYIRVRRQKQAGWHSRRSRHPAMKVGRALFVCACVVCTHILLPTYFFNLRVL